jgi:single-stranded DNA-specific DHH superfamily exonuclease
MTYEQFKLNITNIVTNFLIYFNENPSKAFKILQKISSLEEISKLKKYSEPVENEIKKFVEEFQTKKEKLGDIDFYYINPHFSIKGAIVGILSQQKTRDVFIFASPKDKHITLSARTNDRKKNVIDIIQAGISNLKFGNAGGHPAAAGGIIFAKDLEKFKQNIKDFTKS